jgi:hypothetical protein
MARASRREDGQVGPIVDDHARAEGRGLGDDRARLGQQRARRQTLGAHLQQPRAPSQDGARQIDQGPAVRGRDLRVEHGVDAGQAQTASRSCVFPPGLTTW